MHGTGMNLAEQVARVRASGKPSEDSNNACFCFSRAMTARAKSTYPLVVAAKRSDSAKRCAIALFIASVTIALIPMPASAAVVRQTAAMHTAKIIDGILYSRLSNAVRLAKLQTYVAPMQSMDDVKQRLDLSFCVGGGSGVMDCRVADSGLTIIFDPDGRLRLIRRDARVVKGVAYPAMSVTERGFDWHGYRRWYPE